MVLEIIPPPDSPLAKNPEWQLRFSERIDMSKVHGGSIKLLKGSLSEIFPNDPKALQDILEDEALIPVELEYFLNGNETQVTVAPIPELSEGPYHLVVTSSLTSIKGIPFNQSPGNSPAIFHAYYPKGDFFSEYGPLFDSDPSQSFGPKPEFLKINEILYDGIESESDGEAFIELFGPPGSDISSYEISLINGSNGTETDEIVLPTNSLIGTDGIFVIADLETGSTTTTKVENYDYLDHFDPQNGPDGLILRDREGFILDSLVYGEGSVPQTASGEVLGEGNPALDAGPGHSLSRMEGQDTNNNSTDFLKLENPTPGWL